MIKNMETDKMQNIKIEISTPDHINKLDDIKIEILRENKNEEKEDEE